MKAARIDRSGVFDHVSSTFAKPPPTITLTRFQLSGRGLTFHSDTRVALWTEMEVEFGLPMLAGVKPRRIQCRGVIVQCESSPRQPGYDVTLLFLDLNKRELAEIAKASRMPAQMPVLPRPVTVASARAGASLQ